ncbi:MAG TPA: cytochrome c peroxidase [Thermoanaerobaculia bacterium]|nr:cytochrome c peroxidase [Thermoanaerobaculia bacterium]
MNGAALLLAILLSRGTAAAPAGLPRGFPAPRVPAENPMSGEKVELGRRLFYDPRLSGNGTQSCASCHEQARAFTDGRSRAIGSTGATHPRAAMSLANAAYAASLTWSDPRVRGLEEQALVPLTNEHPVEMGVRRHEKEVLSRLRAEPVYRDLFPRAFPGEAEPITLRNARRAIASFERTIVSGDSAYDRFVWRDDTAGMSEEARRGMSLFFSERLACGSCHGGLAFAGPALWRGGPSVAPRLVNNGIAGGGRFKIPTLRNIAATAPYMHDGRYATLDEVLEHYARGGDRNPDRSRLIRGFSMTAQEKCDIVAFLESLTDEELLRNPELSDPWKSPRYGRKGTSSPGAIGGAAAGP